MILDKRFLIPSYLLNTARIKMQSNWWKLTRGLYPFDYFKDKLTSVWDSDYILNYDTEYKALTYFDYEEAMLFHKKNNSITVDLILGLVYNNSRASLESKVELIGKANDILEKAMDKDDRLSFIIKEGYGKFKVADNSLSAIVQGKAASLFIRCYNNTQDEKWLVYARKSLNHFDKTVSEGGIKRTLPCDLEWMEEYPSDRPTLVLNGYLFWLIGLGEYCAITKDTEYHEIFDRQLKSAISWLPFYKTRRGLIYSMYRWNPCNVHYMAIMKYQFDHLYKLTNVEIFNAYSRHCQTNTNWSVFKKMINLRM